MKNMIVSDLYGALQPYLEPTPEGQLFVLVDNNTDTKCMPILSEFIGKRYYHKIVIEAGEQNKCLSTVEDIWGALISHGATREALLVNLGGGMVTDIGGFAAATYMRGIRFVNIPTTLLAMVDASSGGKTGIDYAGVKNVIGCFSSAKDTLIYPSFLRTLPNKELLSGFAEMLKHALISSNDEWVKLLGIVEDGLAGEELVEYLHHSGVLEASIAIKERIVKEDPREQGLRKILNFGHTVGHAIEALSLENTIQPHGYCVMWGMVAEVYLSVVHKACPREVLQYLTQIMLQLYGRPQCDCKQRDELVNKMYQDKKNSANKTPNFTLLSDVGKPIINQHLTEKDIHEALEYLFSI